MTALIAAVPLTLERASEPQRRQAVARSVQDRCDVSEFDKCDIGREAYPPHNHRATGVVAAAWLAFYLIIVIHHLAAAGG